MNRPKVTIEERQIFLDELQVALNRRKQMNEEGVPVVIPKKERQTQSVPWAPKLNHVPLPSPKPQPAPQIPWTKPKGQVKEVRKNPQSPQQNLPKIQITLSEEQRKIEEEILNIDRETRQLQEQQALTHHEEEQPQPEEEYQHVLEGKMEAEVLPPPCYHEPSLPPVYEDAPEEPVQEPQQTQVEVTPEQPTHEAPEQPSELQEPPVLPLLPPILDLPQQPQPKLHVDKSWKRHTISELKTDNLIERPPQAQHVTAAEKKKKRHSMDVKHLGQRHVVEEPATPEKKKKGIKKLVNIISKAFA